MALAAVEDYLDRRMTQPILRRRESRRRLLGVLGPGLLVFGLMVVGLDELDALDHEQDLAVRVEAAANTDAGGLKTQVIPGQNGHTSAAFVRGQPSPEHRRAMAELVSTSGEGLKIVPSPVEGGGVMVDLRGRFQHAAIAAPGENGTPIVTCVSHVAEDEATP